MKKILTLIILLGCLLPATASATRTYATFDPANKSSNVTLSGGNLTALDNDTNKAQVRSTISKTTGKWYWEYKIDVINLVSYDTGGYVVDGTFNVTTGDAFSGAHAWGFGRDGGSLIRNVNGTTNSNGSNLFTTNNVLGFAYDADANTMDFYVDNTLVTLSSGRVATVGNPGYALVLLYFVNQVTANFGATTQTYSPPSGYNAGLYDDSVAVVVTPPGIIGMF